MKDFISAPYCGEDSINPGAFFAPVIGVHISRLTSEQKQERKRAPSKTAANTSLRLSFSKIEFPEVAASLNRSEISRKSLLHRDSGEMKVYGVNHPSRTSGEARSTQPARQQHAHQSKLKICTVGQDLGMVGWPMFSAGGGQQQMPYRPVSARRPAPSESPRRPGWQRRISVAVTPQLLSKAAELQVNDGRADLSDTVSPALPEATLQGCLPATPRHGGMEQVEAAIEPPNTIEPPNVVPVSEGSRDKSAIVCSDGRCDDRIRIPVHVSENISIVAGCRPVSARVACAPNLVLALSPRRLADASLVHRKPCTVLPPNPPKSGRRPISARFSRPDSMRAQGPTETVVDRNDPRASARSQVRLIAGLGNYLEREAAARALLEMLEARCIDCEWLAEQSALTRGLAAMCRCGTRGQREYALRLLSRLAAGPAHSRHAVAGADGLADGLTMLLRSQNSRELVLPALETIQLLAEDDTGRALLGSALSLVSALVEVAVNFLSLKASCRDDDECAESVLVDKISCEALGALRSLGFRCPANCKLIASFDGLIHMVALALTCSSTDRAVAVHGIALAAEISSTEQCGPEFCRKLAVADGVTALLLRLFSSRDSAELLIHALIVARNLLEAEEGRLAMLVSMPDLFDSLQDILAMDSEPWETSRGAEAADGKLLSQLHVAIVDFLRTALLVPGCAKLVSEFRGLDRAVAELMKSCSGVWRDKVLAFIFSFSEKCSENRTVNQNESIFAYLVEIIGSDIDSISTKMCAAIIRNWTSLNTNLPGIDNLFLINSFMKMTVNPTCIGRKQGFGALCNIVGRSIVAANTLSNNSDFFEFLVANLASNQPWLLHYASLILCHLFVHCNIADAHCEDKNLLDSLLQLNQEDSRVVSQVSKRHGALALAYLTHCPLCCDILSQRNQAAVVKIFYSLFAGSTGPARVVGMQALNNLATRSEEIRICIGLMKAPLESIIQILSCEETDRSDVEVAVSLLKVSIVKHPENSELVASFQNAVPAICSIALRCHPSLTRDALVVLCCLTAESNAARQKQFYTSAMVRVIANGLRSLDNELLLASAGLICNIAHSQEPLAMLESFGKFPGTFSALLKISIAGSSVEIRAGALLALCALAQADQNKLAIGKEPDLHTTICHVLTMGTPSEKANIALLIFHLGFIFTLNSSLGQLPGVLGELVGLVDGDQDQTEKSSAALGVLACCPANACTLMELHSDMLLPSLKQLVMRGISSQKLNALVCLWNLARSSDLAKQRIGLLPELFPILLELIDDQNPDSLWHVIGLLGELVKNSKRNSMLFLKTQGALEKALFLALKSEEEKILTCACTLVVNFALNDEESYIRTIVEHQNGLYPVVTLTRIGLLEDRERALQLLANDFFATSDGRQSIASIPKFLNRLLFSALNGSAKEKEHSSSILFNLTISQNTRRGVLELQGISNLILRAVTSETDTPRVRVSILGCLSNLVMDADFSAELIQNEEILTSLIDLAFSEDDIALEYVMACLHNTLSTSPDFKPMVNRNDRLIDRLVELSRKENRTALHATGAIYQLSKVGPKSPQLPANLLTNPNLIPNLLQGIMCGCDEQKEYGCASLAALGENDDDVSSMADDMFNMMIAMTDGAIELLTRLFINGTPQQSLYATALFSNMLVSAGAFIKTRLAELKNFFPILLQFMESLIENQSMYALRLFFHLVKGDSFISEQACKDTETIERLCDIFERGVSLNQKRYACLSLAELATHRGTQICSYNSGKIFDVISHTLRKQEKTLIRPVIGILKNLALCSESKRYIWRFSAYLSILTSITDQDYQDIAIDALEAITKLGVAAEYNEVVQTISFKRYLSSALAAEASQTRQKAAEILINLCSDTANAATMTTSNLPHTLYNLLLSAEKEERRAVCKVLAIFLNTQSIPAIPPNLNDVLNCFFQILRETRADESLNEDVLKCLVGFSSIEESCVAITSCSSAFETLLLQSKNRRRGCCDQIITILYHILQKDASSIVPLSKCKDFYGTVLKCLKGSINAASLSLKCIYILYNSIQDVRLGLRKEEGFWNFLLLFLDDRNATFTDPVVEQEFNKLRAEALEIMRLYTQLDGSFRGITSQRQAVPILSRMIIHCSLDLRRVVLGIVFKCCDEDLHFSKTLGSEAAAVNRLIDIVAQSTQISESVDPADRVIALKILTLVGRAEQHCLRIGHTKGFMLSMFQTILHYSTQQDSSSAKDSFLRASSSDSKSGTGASALLELYNRQVFISLRHFCSKRPNAEFAIRLPFPVLESLSSSLASSNEADRDDSIEILLSIAASGEQALMIISLRGEDVFRSLAAVIRHHLKPRHRALQLVSTLVVNTSLGRALVDSYETVGALSAIIASEDTAGAAVSAQIFETVAQLDKSHKAALGQMTTLADALVKSSRRTQLSDGDRAATAAAVQTIAELSEGNIANAGLFRRLQEKYAVSKNSQQ